jgi:uncharacterized protein GlcG (DUF336 family)
MSAFTLDTARAIVRAALAEAGRRGLKPLAVTVLDERGSLKASAAQDGTSLSRDKVAHAKAYGALALGLGSRALGKRAEEQPTFIAAVNGVVGGALVPVPGGVLVRDGEGRVLGAVGISGDTSDNDEIAAARGIEAAGLVFDAGA